MMGCQDRTCVPNRDKDSRTQEVDLLTIRHVLDMKESNSVLRQILDGIVD